MKIIRKMFIISAVMFIGSALYPQGMPDFSYAAARAKPSVVYISVFDHENGDKRKGYIKTGYGTGTIVSRDGYILTNNHVVNKGSYYQVIFHDGTEGDLERLPGGEYYIADEEADIALLKLKDPGKREIIPVVFGDSDKLAEGQWVIAIGNPYGLRHSVTCGIISSIGRSDVGFAEIEDFIQTDVPINPGNSGGPLVNDRGEMIGINSAIRTVSGGFQGISFAIPSSMAEKAYRELITYGRVRRGWLGILVKEQRRVGSEIRDIIISSVAKNSPAAAAGIKEGDIVRGADGQAVSTKGKLMRLVKGKEIGSTLNLTISRSGKLSSISIFLREKESFKKLSRALGIFYEKYGIELAEESDTGALVITGLSPHKMRMYNNALRTGDLLLSINGARLKGLDDFARVYARWEYSVSKATVNRDGRVYVIDFSNDRESD